MKKNVLDLTGKNNIVVSRAEQAMLDRIPVDQKTLRRIGKVLEPKNLKRIGIAAVGGSLLISLITTVGRDRINRAATSYEMKKQLTPILEKLNDLEAQNAALWEQNEELKVQLRKLEAANSTGEQSVTES